MEHTPSACSCIGHTNAAPSLTAAVPCPLSPALCSPHLLLAPPATAHSGLKRLYKEVKGEFTPWLVLLEAAAWTGAHVLRSAHTAYSSKVGHGASACLPKACLRRRLCDAVQAAGHWAAQDHVRPVRPVWPAW